MKYLIKKEDRMIKGKITLTGSKSISNRALIIRALSGTQFEIHKLAQAKDTVLMNQLLQSKEAVLDAGPAGTTFRFLTAYLAMQEGTQVLTGSERMKQRPIGVLVEALKQLGANIQYLEKEGYPPLEINTPNAFGTSNQLSISAGTSSQYISALLMIAPTLPNGLELALLGKIVSRPYIEMTLNLMAHFGVEHEWEGQTIKVAPQTYQARPFTVEADWSAASYYYTMAAFSDETDLQLDGLFENSVQGDAVLAEMMTHFGVTTTFNKEGIHLSKTSVKGFTDFSWNFIRCPDLAQSIAVVCGGLGVSGTFTGVETLRIKETDRIDALKIELGKLGVDIQASKGEGGAESFEVSGEAKFDTIPVFDTYEDHRMAMAFAPLGMYHPVHIDEPMVVVKSYPDYYEDLEKMGFEIVK